MFIRTYHRFWSLERLRTVGQGLDTLAESGENVLLVLGRPQGRQGRCATVGRTDDSVKMARKAVGPLRYWRGPEACAFGFGAF